MAGFVAGVACNEVESFCSRNRRVNFYLVKLTFINVIISGLFIGMLINFSKVPIKIFTAFLKLYIDNRITEAPGMPFIISILLLSILTVVSKS